MSLESSAMSSELRILLIEDSEDDAELLLRELRKDGFIPDHRRVDSASALKEALRENVWDIVVTDHNMPGFGSAEAIAIIKETGLDVPVIIVSGSIGEDIAVAAMKDGAHDYIMKHSLARLSPAIKRELRETRNREAHRLAQRTIEHLAHHDPLTGLVNRREFETRLHRALRTASARRQHALLYVDLDQFKVINDTCGHEAGDGMLRQLSVLLDSPIRDSDTLARLGGDEFGVLLTGCSLDEAHQVAERIVDMVRNFRYVWRDKSFLIGASIGLVMLDDANLPASDVLRMADMACYAAKDRGRGRVHIYRADDQELLQRHNEMQWVARLNHALEENRFRLYRQCIMPLSTGGPSHCEILLRMLDEQGDLIPPGAFIPAAERYNLMPALDRWVLCNAFKHLARCRRRGLSVNSEMFFFNLSGATISDESFYAHVSHALREHDLPASMIGFEITETAVITNLGSALQFIEKVRALGCQVALDDFGTGMSSFSYLKAIPADFIKIDGSFVRDMTEDPMNQAIVDAINRIGHVAGLRTIAEFVETDAVKERLLQLGIDYAQGFGIQRPAPLAGDETIPPP
jgi:diguanylate cyclase (GGDEF)-like protein